MEWFAVVKQGMAAAITNYESNNEPFRRDSADPLTAVPLNNVVTTLMTDMYALFDVKTTFNTIISSWDTSSVTNMHAMFGNARAFNQPIGTWNTSAVIIMSNMFNNEFVFNQNLTGWDVDQVTSYSGFRTGSALSIENTPALFR